MVRKKSVLFPSHSGDSDGGALIQPSGFFCPIIECPCHWGWEQVLALCFGAQSLFPVLLLQC